MHVRVFRVCVGGADREHVGDECGADTCLVEHHAAERRQLLPLLLDLHVRLYLPPRARDDLVLWLDLRLRALLELDSQREVTLSELTL